MVPGARLTERELVETTGFGISPIREALTRLDHEGLVQTLPRKGYQIRALTLKSVDDLFAVWRTVGPEIIAVGVREATDEQYRGIVDTVTEMAELSKSAAASDRQNATRLIELADSAFSQIAEATQNAYLLQIFNYLRNDMARIWTLLMQSGGVLPSLEITPDWADLVRRRDGQAAAETARTMLVEMHIHALRIFSRWPSVAASEIVPVRS